MSKVLFQITEEDIRSFAEREDIGLAEENIAEIISAIADMDAEEVITDLFIQYTSRMIKRDIGKCMSCEKRDACKLGQLILCEGPGLVGMNLITISGRN